MVKNFKAKNIYVKMGYEKCTTDTSIDPLSIDFIAGYITANEVD